MDRQNSFMLSKDLGYESDKVIRIKLENQAEFLKIVVKDTDLRKYVRDHLQNEEKRHKKCLEETLYLKNLVELN